MMSRWRKAERNVAARPRYSGIPLARYIFRISPPYNSAREGGRPIKAPMETPITVMEGMSVSLAWGSMEVKISPMRKKNSRGTA